MRITILLVFLLAGHALAAPKWRDFRSQDEAARSAAELAKLNNAQRKQVFKEWKAATGKRYADGSDVDNASFAAFSANLDDVIAHNSQPGIKYFKGLNAFSDMTFEQFKESYLMPDRAPATLAGRTARARKLVASESPRKLLQTAYPLTFDWRDKGVVPAPRNQGGCGSCWAFAALGAMEIKAGIDGVSLRPDASEQQIVDCAGGGVGANGYGSYGCNGGWSDEAFNYASRFFVTSEGSYPYTGVTGTCRQASMPSAGELTVASPGYTGVYNSPQEIMRAVSSKGPVVIYFNVVDNFYGYAGGIYQASQCNANSYNHAMVVVGYNATAGIGNANSYFIIRNSWGTWGDGGYAKVQMLGDSTGACLMYSGLMQPLLTGLKGPCKGKNCTLKRG